jgi:hypothetical protein
MIRAATPWEVTHSCSPWKHIDLTHGNFLSLIKLRERERGKCRQRVRGGFSPLWIVLYKLSSSGNGTRDLHNVGVQCSYGNGCHGNLILTYGRPVSVDEPCVSAGSRRM